MAKLSPKAREAALKIREWRQDPVRFVRECLHADPEEWQIDVLNDAAQLGRKRIAMKACAGPGKTAVLAWLGWHRLACFAAKNEHPKGAAVSIDSDNLSGNLWAEMARWRNESPFLLQSFEWQAKRIFAKDHPETWFLSARGWSKTADMDAVGRTLSGLHSRFPFYLIDESGDIPPNMSRSAEQGLSGCEDGLIVTAGNTTSQSGMLYDVAVTHRCNFQGEEVWKVHSITGDPDDPKRASRVKIDWARENIEKYGRDNPWVMAFILGQFPQGSINALLSVEEVEAAMKLHPRIETYEWAQKRLGIDVARFGDDRTVIFPRQGLAAFPPETLRHKRDTPVSVDIANAVLFKKNQWGSEMEFIDNTVQWAHGAIDVMRNAGSSPMPVEFNMPSPNPRYENLRAQCWWECAQWIKGGGALPHLPGMVAELTTPTYFYRKGKLMIEPKEQIKKRLGRSPDEAEALVLTFALPDMPAAVKLPFAVNKASQFDYDPLSGR